MTRGGTTSSPHVNILDKLNWLLSINHEGEIVNPSKEG